MKYTIFCDESRYLENDKSKAMILGAVLCLSEEENHINNLIKGIKKKYHLNSNVELKWIKVSKSKIDMYKEIVDIIKNNNIFIRVLLADKRNLNHKLYNQTHDEWYYKMYYSLLTYFGVLFNTNYKVFIDIKDTHSNEKAKKLSTILGNTHSSSYQISPVKSNEKQLIQVIDLIIGAVGYKFQGTKTNEAKLELISYIEQELSINLIEPTAFRTNKINIFVWDGEK